MLICLMAKIRKTNNQKTTLRRKRTTLSQSHISTYCDRCVWPVELSIVKPFSVTPQSNATTLHQFFQRQIALPQILYTGFRFLRWSAVLCFHIYKCYMAPSCIGYGTLPSSTLRQSSKTTPTGRCFSTRTSTVLGMSSSFPHRNTPLSLEPKYGHQHPHSSYQIFGSA